MRQLYHLRGVVHSALSIVTLFFIIHDSSLTGMCLPGVRIWMCCILLWNLFAFALLAFRMCDNQSISNVAHEVCFNIWERTLLFVCVFMYCIGWWIWSCSDDIEAATRGMSGLLLTYLSCSTVGFIIYVLVRLYCCVRNHFRCFDVNHNVDVNHLNIVSQSSVTSVPSEQLLPHITHVQFVQRKFDESKDYSSACTICLNSFDSTSTIIVLPCLHEYDQSCIEQWLQVQSSCPMCRCHVMLNQV